MSTVIPGSVDNIAAGSTALISLQWPRQAVEGGGEEAELLRSDMTESARTPDLPRARSTTNQILEIIPGCHRVSVDLLRIAPVSVYAQASSSSSTLHPYSPASVF